jgi:GT2 family glycosyltransferase
MKQPLVYIIILNWNGYKDTIKCLESVQEMTYKNFRIILVDNASSNESVKILRNKFPKIKTIVNHENLGYAGGNNIGIKYALKNNADYVLILNNDTTVSESLLRNMLCFSENNKSYSLFSPKILYMDTPEIIYSSGGYKNYKTPYPFYDNEWHKKFKFSKSEFKEVDVLIGCCLLIRKEVFDRIGYIDESYFLYAEDIDFCFRARNANFKLATLNNVTILHKGGASSGGSVNATKDYYDTRNIILLGKKFLSIKEQKIYLYNFLKGRLYEIKENIKKKRYKNSIAILKGILHGLLGISGKKVF